MFDYRYTVKSSDGYEWGLFKSKGVASLLCDALIKKFDSKDFWIEEIK